MPSGPPTLLEGQTALVGRVTSMQPEKAEAPGAAAPAAPPAPQSAPQPQAGAGGSVADRLGLPTDLAGVSSHIATNYRGVGPKSVQTLIDTFGAARIFDALENQPDRVREVLGAARGERLLEAWREDVNKREPAEADVAKKSAGRGRRGRGRSAAGKAAAKTAAPPPAKPASESAPEASTTDAATAPKKATRRGGRGRRGKTTTK
jgi:hypothetical protein